MLKVIYKKSKFQNNKIKYKNNINNLNQNLNKFLNIFIINYKIFKFI